VLRISQGGRRDWETGNPLQSSGTERSFASEENGNPPGRGGAECSFFAEEKQSVSVEHEIIK
jgi:hypothetical protein